MTIDAVSFPTKCPVHETELNMNFLVSRRIHRYQNDSLKSNMFAVVVQEHHHCLKTGYMGFAWLESSVDATPIVILRPAVAMAAEVHCQRLPAGLNITAGVGSAENSNQANPI